MVEIRRNEVEIRRDEVDIRSNMFDQGRKKAECAAEKKVPDLTAAEEVAGLLGTAQAILPALLSKLGGVIIQMFDQQKKVRLG